MMTVTMVVTVLLHVMDLLHTIMVLTIGDLITGDLITADLSMADLTIAEDLRVEG